MRYMHYVPKINAYFEVMSVLPICLLPAYI
jgi:hypothetical protein